MFPAYNTRASLHSLRRKLCRETSLVDNCCLHLKDDVEFSAFNFACACGEKFRVLEVEVCACGMYFGGVLIVIVSDDHEFDRR